MRSLKALEEAIRQALSGPKKTILWVAPSMSRARAALIKTVQLTECKLNITHSEIVFKNGSKIYFASHHNPDKLRGLRLNGAFIEEGVNQKAQDIINICMF